MLGQKINKSIITQEQCNHYASVAEWCNNNNAHLEDKGEFYEVVENEVITPAPINDTPTLEQRINDIELALMELAGDL